MVGTERERALVLLLLGGELTGCAADWYSVGLLGCVVAGWWG